MKDINFYYNNIYKENLIKIDIIDLNDSFKEIINNINKKL